MFTARIVTDSSDNSTILSGRASVFVMQSESGALFADRWVEVEVDEDGVIRVFAGEGDDEHTEVYNSVVTA